MNSYDDSLACKCAGGKFESSIGFSICTEQWHRLTMILGHEGGRWFKCAIIVLELLYTVAYHRTDKSSLHQ